MGRWRRLRAQLTQPASRQNRTRCSSQVMQTVQKLDAVIQSQSQSLGWSWASATAGTSVGHRRRRTQTRFWRLNRTPRTVTTVYVPAAGMLASVLRRSAASSSLTAALCEDIQTKAGTFR